MTILEKARKIKEFCICTNLSDEFCKVCKLNNTFNCCVLSIDDPTCFCRQEKDRHAIPHSKPLALARLMEDIKDYCYKQDCATCEYNHEKRAKKRAEGYNYCDVRETLPKHFVIEKPMDLILGGK